MSEQSEREAYNEAAREYHEGKEREEMDRPMFTQRDVDAAVQGEREAIRQWCLKQESQLEGGNDCDAGSRWALADVRKWIDARPSIAVDVMAVVRRLATARAEIKAIGEGPLTLSMDAINAANERRRTFLAIVDELCALVDGKGGAKENDNG